MSGNDDLKRSAGEAAAGYVRSGNLVGLGSGSTARFATLRIGDLLASNELRDVVAVPTSEATAELARGVAIPLASLEDVSHIDVTIDGADEVDPELNLIKGLGGALLREKVVASITSLQVIVVDDSKLVQNLGTRVPLPVEVVPFGWKTCVKAMSALGCEPRLRMQDGGRYLTDEGNHILDCRFERIVDAYLMEQRINNVPGVVENGLFVGLADVVVVASPTGLRTLRRDESTHIER